ncbi:MAG: hypothetical protein D6698_16115, partial [Gammaproteobacteria bacterium]
DAATWGVNEETLTGDKTLTTSDPIVQFLDPGGAGRKVTLPALSDSVPFFVICNRGASESLIVEDSGGSAVFLGPGQAVQVFAHSGGFFALRGDLAKAGYLCAFEWGANVGVSSRRFLTAGGQYNASYQSTESGLTRHYVPDARDAFLFSVSRFSTGAATMELVVDGAVAETFNIPSGSNYYSKAIAHSWDGGELLGVTHSDVSSYVLATVWCLVPSKLSTIQFGGSLGLSSSYRLYVNYPHESGSTTVSAYYSATTVPEALTLDSLSYTTDSTGTISAGIYKNGALDQTVSLVGTEGKVSLSPTSFAAGDTLEVRGVSGAQYATKVFVAFSGGSSQAFLQYFCNPLSGNYFVYIDSYYSVGSSSSNNPTTRKVVASLAPTALGIYANGSLSGHSLKILKNGALDQTVSLSDASGKETATLTATVYSRGDDISVQNGAANILYCNFSIGVKNA